MTFWVAGAVVGTSLIGADAARSAGNQAQDATNAGIGEQRRQFDTTNSNFAPYRQVGNWALQQLTGSANVKPVQSADTFDAGAYLRANPDVAADPYWSANALQHYQQHGQGEGRQFAWNADAQQQMSAPATAGDLNTPFSFSGEDAMKEPGYKFGLDQGQQQLDRKIAAMGGRVSGAALKAAAQFGNDYGSTKYGQAYDRQWQARGDRLNRLQALAGVAQTATANTAQAGQGSANAISGLLQSGGEYAAAGTLARGNTWANTGNQLAAIYSRKKAPVVDGYNYFGDATDIPMQPGGGR